MSAAPFTTIDELQGDRDTLVDANGDGYANIRHVFDGSTEKCTELDLNFDGRVDMTRMWKNGVSSVASMKLPSE